jgi:GNAT superfamily N-acetyltransferase
MNTTFTARLATVAQQPIVIGLIDGASVWLRGKDTDQWAKPWPDRAGRDGRVRRGLELGETWIVWDGDVPAATMTICQRANPDVWPEGDKEDAVYIHRLVVSRAYAGRELGGLMIDWAVQRELRTRQVEWVRVDVWSTNSGLHDYYERQGFIRCGACPDPGYPSGALFQKAAEDTRKTDTSRLVEEPSAWSATL